MLDELKEVKYFKEIIESHNLKYFKEVNCLKSLQKAEAHLELKSIPTMELCCGYI